MEEVRADYLLVEVGLLESRSQAKDWILQGRVMADGVCLKKPSQKLNKCAKITLTHKEKFVSRAGYKLYNCIEQLDLDVKGCTALDVGASTGGFTDCLLQKGVSSVSCVDVGHGQLHPKIKNSPKVTSFEGVNAKELDKTTLPLSKYDIVVVDLSFISIKKVIRQIWNRVAENGHLLALIKPQFELGVDYMNKCKGVIKNTEDAISAYDEVLNFCTKELDNMQFVRQVATGLPGKEGNQECFLVFLKSQTKHI